MVRDIAVELRRRKHQGNGQQQQHQQLLHDPSSEGGRGLTMAELNLEALKVYLDLWHFCMNEQ